MPDECILRTFMYASKIARERFNLIIRISIGKECSHGKIKF